MRPAASPLTSLAPGRRCMRGACGMRLSPATLVILCAVAALVALGVTDQILPADRSAHRRAAALGRRAGARRHGLPAARARGRPRPASSATRATPPSGARPSRCSRGTRCSRSSPAPSWSSTSRCSRSTRSPTSAWSARSCRASRTYRPVAVGLGTVALYALIFTAATAKWTRLLPSGWWLKVHRFAAVTFLADLGARGPRRHRRRRPDRPCTSRPACRSWRAWHIAGGPRGVARIASSPQPDRPRRTIRRLEPAPVLVEES